MSAFDAALKIIVGDEGRRDNDPRDPGGETAWGHDQASWLDVRLRMPADIRAQMPARVRDLTWSQAVQAYRWGHWNAFRCDDLPPPLALALFDSEVNQGPGWAPQELQAILGVRADGQIGPITVQAARGCDVLDVLTRFTGERLLRYQNTAGANTYLRGWGLRALRTCALALSYST